MRRALLALLVAGCDAPPASAPPEADAGRGRPDFVDAGALPDGTVIRADAAGTQADAAFLVDGGVCPRGSVSGVVCAPGPDGDGGVPDADGGAPAFDRRRPIIGAEVVAATRDCYGDPTTVRAVSGRDGGFKLEGLAPGPAEVTVRAGNFLASYLVEIFDGADIPLENSRKKCLESDAASLAVLSGDFDQIQSLITDLGFRFELFCGESANNRSGRALLQDWDALRAHNVVFVNCATGIDLRATNPETQRIVDNLRRFVAEGGSVYVSDLSADFVGLVWPGFIDFEYEARAAHEEPACCVCGVDCDAACVEGARASRECPGCCGQPNEAPASCGGGLTVRGHGEAQHTTAVVPDENLRAYLEHDEMPVAFPLGGWVRMRGVQAGVEVLVEGAPGTPQAGQPLMVLFQPAPGGGRVAYTSFHNHDQAGPEMKAILSALIFRL